MSMILTLVLLSVMAILAGRLSRQERGAAYYLAAALAALQTAVVLIGLLTMKNPVE